MQNTLVYYLAIVTPFAALIWAAKEQLMADMWFTVGLFCYLFVYRTFTDTWRLHAKGVIDKKDFRALIIPFSRIKYFKALYLP